jgi:hypothetical protein
MDDSECPHDSAHFPEADDGYVNLVKRLLESGKSTPMAIPANNPKTAAKVQVKWSTPASASWMDSLGS